LEESRGPAWSVALSSAPEEDVDEVEVRCILEGELVRDVGGRGFDDDANAGPVAEWPEVREEE
jgi:hypothetical protein